MTFEPGHREAFAWIWLPGAREPVVCGRVDAMAVGEENIFRFIYGRSYRALDNAIPLAPHELHIGPDAHTARRGLHGVLRDAAPDAWGRRVLMYRLEMSDARANAELTDIDLLLAGANGVGALHFQESADRYAPRRILSATIEQLVTAAEAVEENRPLPRELIEALQHGTSIGGARPKALLRNGGGRPAIAKFSSTTDMHPIVRLEALALDLAHLAGIDAIRSERVRVANRDVLIVERFDLDSDDAGAPRRHFFSALTALGLDESETTRTSYLDLAAWLRKYADNADRECSELYRRMLFNMMIGNTDDHARNHALFWDGKWARLTPAYDICILPRASLDARQAMAVGEQGRLASLKNAFSGAGQFGFDMPAARALAEELETAIRENWAGACARAGITSDQAARLMDRTVLSPALKE